MIIKTKNGSIEYAKSIDSYDFCTGWSCDECPLNSRVCVSFRKNNPEDSAKLLRVTILSDKPKCESYTKYKVDCKIIPVCIRTKEHEECTCHGDKRLCNFYPKEEFNSELEIDYKKICGFIMEFISNNDETKELLRKHCTDKLNNE